MSCELNFTINVWKQDDAGNPAPITRRAERILSGEKFTRDGGDFVVTCTDGEHAVAVAQKLLAVIQGLDIMCFGDGDYFALLDFYAFKPGVLDKERASELSQAALAIV